MKNYKFEIFFYVFILVLLLLLVVSARGQEAEQTMSGGQFSITKTVVTGGGGEMQENQTSANNTAGQTIAGKQSVGGTFTLYTGFWTPEDFAPTAATAVVGGFIKTYAGAGIRNVAVTITFPDGEIRRTTSGSFGFYSFNDIPTGETYVISVSARRYSFAPSALVKSILDDTRDIDFTAEN